MINQSTNILLFNEFIYDINTAQILIYLLSFNVFYQLIID